MRLNADILLDKLEKKYTAAYYGPQVTRMHLKRPQIYDVYQGQPSFTKNRTYCLTTDSLPQETDGERELLLICVGHGLPEQYRTGHIPCIWLDCDPQRIIEVFNTVQEIFDQFDDWDYTLQKILNTTASIQEMVDCCQSVIQNPIIVIDASLRFLGYSRVIDTDSALENYRPGQDGKVQLDNLKGYLAFRDSYTKAGPLFYDDNRIYIWDVWHHGRYLGNMTIPYVHHMQEKSDRWVLSTLEPYIANALSKYINNPELRSNVLRNTFQDLLEDKPLRGEAITIMTGFSGQYLCMRLRFRVHNEHSQPISFYCSYVENALPGSVCFEYAASIVVFMDISEPEGTPQRLPKLRRIAEEMNVTIGVSNPFREISQAKYYYRQAYLAVKLGKADPDGSILFFRDYVLGYLLDNAAGEMPLESLYSEGLQRLLRHDAASKVSFAETLLVYLRNAMNITKTALDLKIHRSSFLERLHNIESLLDTDLEDPRERLYLQILLERIVSE